MTVTKLKELSVKDAEETQDTDGNYDVAVVGDDGNIGYVGASALMPDPIFEGGEIDKVGQIYISGNADTNIDFSEYTTIVAQVSNGATKVSFKNLIVGRIYRLFLFITDKGILNRMYFNPKYRLSQEKAIEIFKDGESEPGKLVPAFDMTGTIPSIYNITHMKIQSDDKVLMTGFFKTFKGVAASNMVRVLQDGSLDPSFNIGTGFTTSGGGGLGDGVRGTCFQIDGKILAVGDFTIFNGTPRQCIVRLNVDGSLDTSFYNGAGPTFVVGGVDSGGEVKQSYSQTIAVQLDGKIIVTGDFDHYHGHKTSCIARLHSDGNIDTSFQTVGEFYGSPKSINPVAIQPDGKIIAGGYFQGLNSVETRGLIRLNSNGTHDTTFNIGTAAGQTSTGGSQDVVSDIKIQPDGKVIVVGRFSTFNGVAKGNVVRLNPNGSIDTSFWISGSDQYIANVHLLTGGKFLFVGWMNQWNGSSGRSIMVTFPDGSRDYDFSMTGGGAYAPAFNSDVFSNGDFLLGGTWTTWSGVSVPQIVRLGNGFRYKYVIIDIISDGNTVILK